LLTDDEVEHLLEKNPQNHKEAGFDKGWPTRFATIFDLAKEFGFVNYWQGKKIQFSEIGLKLANSINIKTEDGLIMTEDSHPEYVQLAFLNALVKYQRNNPFVRVLNENSPLILLLSVIKLINEDKEYGGSGISKLELPLIIFWKNNDADELYKLIKEIRKNYGYSPSPEVIIDICINKIMEGKFKKFNPKSILVDYPDEFIRKMRLTGLISFRGSGRFIDINKNEQKKVDYVLEKYSTYKKYITEDEYFEYMSTVDENFISFSPKPFSISERDAFLLKWSNIYSWNKIKTELLSLAKRGLSKDDILKYLSNPVRLEFLVSLAIKSRFPKIKVVANYPYDDEGLPTSTASGIGDRGDIECFEDGKGILIEVTMSEGRVQTMLEVWPISRHLEKFKETIDESMCYFVAPSIFRDTVKQINFVKDDEGLLIIPKTIDGFLSFIEDRTSLYALA